MLVPFCIVCSQLALFLVAACVVVKVFDKGDEKRRNNKVHPEEGEKAPRPGKKGGGPQGPQGPPGPQAQPLPSKGGPPPPYEQGGAANPGQWDF